MSAQALGRGSHGGWAAELSTDSSERVVHKAVKAKDWPANAPCPAAKWNLLKHMEATVCCTASFLARNCWRAEPGSLPDGTSAATVSLLECATGVSESNMCLPSSLPSRCLVAAGDQLSPGFPWSRGPALLRGEIFVYGKQNLCYNFWEARPHNSIT